MRRVNTFAFYTLAKHLKPIEALPETTTYGEVVLPLVNARWQVESLLNNEVVPLRICRHAALQLINTITDIVPKELQEAFKSERDRTEVISWWHLNPIREAASRFETVLAEELNVQDTYSVAQKGVYATAELIESAERMIPESLRAKMSDQAIFDLREAGKCLAFETPTASAFHLLRSVESMLLAYYELVTESKAPTRMRNWGVYIKNLRATGKADPKILDFLDHIRETYRNPISHPEATITTDEMLVLFGVATAAIVQIAIALN